VILFIFSLLFRSNVAKERKNKRITEDTEEEHREHREKREKRITEDTEEEHREYRDVVPFA
jgi:hypothetical protein